MRKCKESILTLSTKQWNETPSKMARKITSNARLDKAEVKICQAIQNQDWVDRCVHNTLVIHIWKKQCVYIAHSILKAFLPLAAIYMNSISVGSMPGWRYQTTVSSPSNTIRKERESTLTLSLSHSGSEVGGGQSNVNLVRLAVTREITRGGGISRLDSRLTPPTVQYPTAIQTGYRKNWDIQKPKTLSSRDCISSFNKPLSKHQPLYFVVAISRCKKYFLCFAGYASV